MGEKNRIKITKGHQVQIFKKSIFQLLCTEKAFWASWDVKIRSRSPKVIKYKFSKFLVLSSYAFLLLLESLFVVCQHCASRFIIALHAILSAVSSCNLLDGTSMFIFFRSCFTVDNQVVFGLPLGFFTGFMASAKATFTGASSYVLSKLVFFSLSFGSI